MASLSKLPPAQQEILDNLKRGCRGIFWTKLSDWGYYVHAELRSGKKTLDVKITSVRALERKGLVKMSCDEVTNRGQFVLAEAT